MSTDRYLNSVSGAVRSLATRGAVAIGLVLCVVGCATSPGELSTGSSENAIPGALPVQVDIYSGRENPSAILGERAASQVSNYVRGHLQAGQSIDESSLGLGFRGFVIDLPVGEECSAIRVLPQAVICESGTAWLLVDDKSGSVYHAVWEDIHDQLSPEVVAAIQASKS